MARKVTETAARALALAGALALALPATADAVWPGGTGRLAVYAQLFDPPATAPVVSYGFIRTLRFSPDGTRIASMKAGPGGYEAVWISDVDGTNQKQISFPGQYEKDLTPTWTPDGTELVMDRYRVGDCGDAFCY